MKNIKRLSGASLLAVLLLYLTIAGVIGTVFHTNIVVQETSGNSYDMLGISVLNSNTFLVNNGYITTNGTDVQIGTFKRLLASDRTLFATPIIALTSNSYQWSSNNTPSNFSIITGYSGNITTLDDADLEPSSNSTIALTNVWLNTTLGVSKYLGDKFDSVTGNGLRFYVSPLVSGNLTATVYSANTSIATVTSTGVTSAEHDLILKCNSVETTANQTLSNDYLPVAVGNYLRVGQYFTAAEFQSIVGTNPVIITQIGFWMFKNGVPTGTGYFRIRNYDTDAIIGTLGSIDVSTIGTGYYYGNTNPVYIANTDQPIRICFEFSGGVTDVDNILIYHQNADVGTGQSTRYAVAWTQSAGDCRWTMSWGNTLELWIDGVLSSYARMGLPVPNSTANWGWMQSNSVAYCDSISISVAGTQKLLYQPNNIISGTTLPDIVNSGGYENGIISWGSNPTGISSAFSYLSMVTTDVSVSGLESPSAVGIIGVPDNIHKDDSDLTMMAHEYYTIVADVASLSNINIEMIWWFISAVLAIAALTVVRVNIPSSMIAGFVMVAVMSAFVSMSGGCLEWWMPAIVLLGIFAQMAINKIQGI